MKHNTSKPAINTVKSKEKLEKINKKRAENFGYINKEDWERIRDERKALEDEKFKSISTLQPALNDNFNAKCKKVQDRGTGKDWVKQNATSVDDWVKIRDEKEELLVERIEKDCPFAPKCEQF